MENINNNLRNQVRWTESTPDNSKASKTPSKKSKKFERDAVAAYHFAGVPNTPWSKKKRSLHGKQGYQQQSSKKQREKSNGESKQDISFGEKELVGQNTESTFDLGGTASLASIYGDLNASVLSTASGASNTSGVSNVSGVSGASSASSCDLMNQTTLSDTHELSTSNFIMSARVRGVVRERAVALGLGDKKKVNVAMKKEKGGDVLTEATMTLPDLTHGDLDEMIANLENQGEDAAVSAEMEFTSNQKELSILGGSGMSSLGSNGILANLDTTKSAGIDEEKQKDAETSHLSLGLSSIKSVENDRESLVESTASQNDLDAVLNVDSPMEYGDAGVEATTRTSNANATPQTSQVIGNSALRQSPSFIAGKKKSLPWRKSTGGEDLAKIRALTASLKKSHRDNLRLSLPAIAPKSSVMEKNSSAAKDPSKVLLPVEKSVEKESKSSSRQSKRMSPTKPTVDSPARITRSTKKYPAKSPQDDEMMEFTSHQRGTPGRKRKELAMLDNSPTTSSLGLNDILAHLSDSETETSTMDESRMVSLNMRSPSKSQKPLKSPSKTPVDSPARNTRSAKKSPAKSPSQPKDSPARNTRSSNKSLAKSPLQTDSPARNTRSAKKSPVDSSPTRSLFNSPLSPGTLNQLDDPAQQASSPISMEFIGERPFSGRKKRNHSSSKDAMKSLKKRASLDNSLNSEPSSNMSLSKAYPFLSKNTSIDLSTDNSAKASEDTLDCGTDTLQFNQLMKDIDAMPDKSTMSENSNVDESTGLSSFSDESFTSVHQVRNKRRETADLNDLAAILGGKRTNANSSDTKDENITPPPTKLHTPTAGSAAKTPKSILNSSNKIEKFRSNKKLVMFGSPETAIYNIGSPSTSFTPMQPNISQGKTSNQMEEVDKTTELEGDITQMITKASDPSLMGLIDESCIEDESSIGMAPSLQLISGEKTEELETNISSLVNNSGEDSVFSLPSVSHDSEGTPDNVRMAEHMSKFSEGLTNDTSSMEVEETLNLSVLAHDHCRSDQPEATQTIAIEGTMASLLDAAETVSGEARNEDSHTMEIEGTIGSLLNKADPIKGDVSQTIELEGTIASLFDKNNSERNHGEFSTKQSRQSLAPLAKSTTQESNLTYSTLTIPINGCLEAFADKTEGTNLQKLSNGTSVECENNGSIQFSNEHVANDDDTVSELGMNTSQELSDNSEVQVSLKKIIEDKQAEPIDLKIEELLKYGSDELKLNTREDVILNSLDAASRSSFKVVKKETEDVLTQVCSDIESQVSMISVDADFADVLDRNEDAMRVLQRNIRSSDGDVFNEINNLFEAVHASALSEWDSWLNQVANLYNDQLHDTAVGELEKDSISISDKTSDINYNREQIALPMLLRSASRATKRNYTRQQTEINNLDDEVAQLEAELKVAQRDLDALAKRKDAISEIFKSSDESMSHSIDTKTKSRSADSSFYKFFSIEKLHNWIVTSSNDSYIGLVFKGSSPETNLHLSFWITESSNTAFDCKVGPLPRSVNSLISQQKVRFHPAVCSFLNKKMNILCKDLKQKTRIDSASKISPLIQSVEHRVARIEHAAKEFDTILSQCKNSFLQASDTVKDGFDFHAYVTSISHPGVRIQVTLTLSECYPFAPIGVRLHSTDSSLNTDSMIRQIQKYIKPGFGTLSKAINAINRLLKE